MTEFKSHSEMVICCVADMTDEQRQEFVLSLPDESVMKKVIVEGIKTGEIKRCPKTDWCRLEREKKEKEEKQNRLHSKEQAERIVTLESREVIWEEDARKKEIDSAHLRKEFNEYKALSEARISLITQQISSMTIGIEKLASLVSQLIK